MPLFIKPNYTTICSIFFQVKIRIKENNLQIRMNEELEAIDKENTYIKNQIPQSGIVVNEESAVTIEV